MLKLGALRKMKVWKEAHFSQQVIHSSKVIKCLDKYCWCRTACVLKKQNKKQLLSHGQNIIFRMILDLFWLFLLVCLKYGWFLFLPLTAPAGQHSGGSPGLRPAAAGMSSYAWTGHENRHRDRIPAWGGHAGNAEETGTAPDNRCESHRCCWFLLMWWLFQTVFGLFIFVCVFLKYFLLVIVSNSICLVHFVSNSICHMSGVIVLNSIWLVFIGDCFKQCTCGLFMFLLVIVSNSIWLVQFFVCLWWIS